MQAAKAAAVFSLALLAAGCSTYFRDRASDYRSATEAPPLVLPAGQESRPIRPLYPIPPGTEVAFDPKKKFEAPKPKPLLLPETAAATPDAGPAPEAGVQKPALTQDGNGYAVVSITGDFNAIWDRLDEALRAAKVKVDDRDQRVGLYYLELAEEGGKTAPYQLRVTRGQSAYTLALQKDDETLATQAMTKTLFESIVNNWPQASGDFDGKARPPLHR
ncbi:MAG TPA: outer membrane protein assembly factor BamC [Moraxellaceae bacterium]